MVFAENDPVDKILIVLIFVTRLSLIITRKPTVKSRLSEQQSKIRSVTAVKFCVSNEINTAVEMSNSHDNKSQHQI